MTMRVRDVLFACSMAVLAACGGAQAEISHDDRAREDDSLVARGFHDDVVRMTGDSEGLPRELSATECESFCRTYPGVDDRTRRLCAIAERDPNDEATQFLCEDARTRSSAMRERGSACACE